MRSDMLVSVAVADTAGPRETIPRLAAASATLAQVFRYFEVVYALDESKRAELDELGPDLAGLTNLRIIVTSEGTRFYRRRFIAAREAIGDVVALVDLDEVPLAELVPRIIESKESKEVLAALRPPGGPGRWTYRLLSLASRFMISPRAGRTIILPRDWLSVILARESAVIELRFQPRIPVTRYRRFDVPSWPIGGSGNASRYDVLIEIMRSDAPRYLKAYALAGFFVVLGSIAYMAYALAVLLLMSNVQQGWFSSAVVQAGSTAFIAGGMSILSIAMVAVLEAVRTGNHLPVIAEIGNTNYFDNVVCRNVEVS
jgi:hypothetical protein